MAPTIIQQEDGQIVFLSDPQSVGVPSEIVVVVGNQPADEKALKFSQIVGFVVTTTDMSLKPLTLPSGSASGSSS